MFNGEWDRRDEPLGKEDAGQKVGCVNIDSHLNFGLIQQFYLYLQRCIETAKNSSYGETRRNAACRFRSSRRQ